MSTPHDYSDTVARAIADAIAASGSAINAVSAGTHIPYSTLSRSLACARAFNVEEVARIAHYLSVDVLDLMAPGTPQDGAA